MSRTTAIIELAQLIYDEKAFDRVSELAHVLEDAGCASEEILHHCRESGPHVAAVGLWISFSESNDGA